MRPPRADIAAPELPPRVAWLNVTRRPSMAALAAAGPTLVHFFDFAQLNSVRSLPYVRAWQARYSEAGLSVLGIHTPRFPFTAERRKLAAAIRHLGLVQPVADDSGYAIWRDYGCHGWPSLFLWGQGGALRWAHFGEGEYVATEEAIQAELRELDALRELPLPLDPLRASDAPGAGVLVPTEEVLPGGSVTEPWRAGGDPLELDYEGAGAYAAVDGEGELRVSVDGGPERVLAVDLAGLYELAEHGRHESHGLRLEASEGVDVYSVAFAPGIPA